MADNNNNNKVEIVEGHAQWKILCFVPYPWEPGSPENESHLHSESKPFKMGIWNWVLSIEMKRTHERQRPLGCRIHHKYSGRFERRTTSVKVQLFLAESQEAKPPPPPLARFSLHVTADGYEKESTGHDGLLRTRDDFAFPIQMRPNAELKRNHSWPIGFHIDDGFVVQPFKDRYVIDVEFWELSISPTSDGEEAISVWPTDGRKREAMWKKREAKLTTTLKRFSRMLNESLYTDITINTVDGKLQAHRAVLSTSSSVFQSMFAHNLKEKQSSTIDMKDMTSESCMSLLNYMYGTINKEDFWKNRLELLAAADKYNISELMDACEESLLEDIGVENVVERLKEAKLYNLTKLKNDCITYLYESKEIRDSLRNDDSERVDEIVQEMHTHLDARKRTKTG